MVKGTGVIDTGEIDAVLVDLDGVVTKTMMVHAAAWKRLFDGYLAERAARQGEAFQPFDIDEDYRRYVDGLPRDEGVRRFLESRMIVLPDGDPSDGFERETVSGLGARKNRYFNEHLRQHGVEVYASSLRFLRQARSRGLRTAVVTSSKNCETVLRSAGIEDLFDVRVDGLDALRHGLRGKPAPDTYLHAAASLDIVPARAAMIEDALAGVRAGRDGGFRIVIGVDRTGHAEELRAVGADFVVSDLSEITIRAREPPTGPVPERIPLALRALAKIGDSLADKRVNVFLDYDGTLTPIVTRPELAVLSDPMRTTIRALAELCPVAVVSGRERADVARLVGLDNVYCAGSHGFDIVGPGGIREQPAGAIAVEPALRRAEAELRRELANVEGVIVEGKSFAVAVHYRLVAEAEVARVRRTVEAVMKSLTGIEVRLGKKVFDIVPALEWDKGKAIRWLKAAIAGERTGAVAVYLGDDVTDEDAFREVSEGGIGLLVSEEPRATLARYRLRDPDEVHEFLKFLVATLRR